MTEFAFTRYDLAGGVATITMDDGKVNALSTAMLTELGGRLDQAAADDAVVVLAGRPRTFSAGFDLRCEPAGWPEMLLTGARTAERLLTHPRPVIAACAGNAIAMGAFLLLSCDLRIGVQGDFRLGLNETAIGMTLPWFGIALARHRLTAPAFDRCTVTGALLAPDAAVRAGFLDEAVGDGEFEAAVAATAQAALALNAEAHAATKLRIRTQMLAELRDGIARITDPEREL